MCRGLEDAGAHSAAELIVCSMQQWLLAMIRMHAGISDQQVRTARLENLSAAASVVLSLTGEGSVATVADEFRTLGENAPDLGHPP